MSARGGNHERAGGTTSCRHCGDRTGAVVLDLGDQPHCEEFPPADRRSAEILGPLRMWLCSGCGLAQLVGGLAVAEEAPSSVEPRTLREQARSTLEMLAEQGLLRRGTTVIEHGSPHSPSWRTRLEGLGARPLDGGRADLVLDVYGLLHEHDQDVALDVRVRQVARDGALVLQLHSIVAAVRHEQYGELRHGHFAYWSLPALEGALRRRGLGVHRAREFPLDDGTAVVIARREPAPDPVTVDLLRREAIDGALDPVAMRGLQIAAEDGSRRLRTWLRCLSAEGAVVVGYGAASRAVPVLCHAGVDRTLLRAVGDLSPAKQGRLFPGTGIPVVSPAEMTAMRPDVVLLLLPDLLAEVRDDLPEVERHGGRWQPVDLLPVP